MRRKRLAAFTAAAAMAAAIPGEFIVGADNSPLQDTGITTKITVRTDDRTHEISPLIYGIADTIDPNGINPTVLTDSGIYRSSYNWENNCINYGISMHNSNDLIPHSGATGLIWETPGLAAKLIDSKASAYNIRTRLLTLPMMGYAAKDSLGTISDDESVSLRMINSFMIKDGNYLFVPDTSDSSVYTDEYVAYLVHKYHSSSNGGFFGYFLDSEPEKWRTNYPFLDLPELTPDELVDRSAALAAAIKNIDENAMVFGPSLANLQSCINLKDSGYWNNNLYVGSDYSWFMDYYLGEMKARSNLAKKNLLDCLDIHYYTEAVTAYGTSVLTSNDESADATRMQVVRTLWDSNFTENSPMVIKNNIFTPIIPTLKASIRMYYPGTKLSVSAYDFGGGRRMSGAIAQTDALGIFARESVYLACLSPVSETIDYQKAAFALYTNYDGEGGSFGDTYVETQTSDKESMCTAYSSIDSSDPDTLKIIVTNHYLRDNNDISIDVQAKEKEFFLENVYAIDEDTATVIGLDTENFSFSANSVDFSAEPTSAYLLVLSAKDKTAETEATTVYSTAWVTEPDDNPAASDVSDDELPQETSQSVSDNHNNETSVQSGNTTINDISDHPQPSSTSAEPAVTGTSADKSESAEQDDTQTGTPADNTEVSESEITKEDDKSGVSMPVRVIVSALAVTVGAGIIYILFFDRS